MGRPGADVREHPREPQWDREHDGDLGKAIDRGPAPLAPASKLTILPAKTVEWSTPQPLFDALDAEFHFTVDAAASALNHKCPRYWSKDDSGLRHPWAGERVFCNPPWGVTALTKFTRMAMIFRCVAAFIVPVKSDQRWWHEHAIPHAEIRFIQGRVTFGDAPNCYPAPVAVLVFGTGRTGSFSMERPK